MNVTALQKLHEVIDSIPRHKFDMTCFLATSVPFTDEASHRDIAAALDRDCGTTACLAGWATRHEWFEAQELRFVKPPDNSVMVGWGDHVGFKALQLFFGLSYVECDFLFNSQMGEKPTPATLHWMVDAVIENDYSNPPVNKDEMTDPDPATLHWMVDADEMTDPDADGDFEEDE